MAVSNKMVTLDMRDARRKLGALGRSLQPSEVNLALARAINRTTTAGRTAAIREIKKTYRVKSKAFNKASKKNGTSGNSGTTKATRVKPVGSINIWGTPMPVADFGARQNRKGVTVNIKGKRHVIKSAFWATMPSKNGESGHKGVFARGTYKASGFEPGKRRLPINEIKTVSQGVMFSEPGVMERSLQRTDEMFPKRMEHELNFIIAGIYKKGNTPLIK